MVAILFLFVGCSCLWISFMPLTEPHIYLQDMHDTDPLPDLDHDHTLTITRCLGACSFVLLAMVFPQVFTWIASWTKSPEVTPSPPSSIRNPPEDASTEMLLRITELLTKMEARSAPLPDPATPAAQTPELPPMPPPVPRPPPVPPIIQTTPDLEPISTVSPTVDGMDAISMAQTMAETC